MQSFLQTCLSCLGIYRDEPQDEENQHLLDQQNMQYGATDTIESNYLDPEEQRRQREALAKLQQETTSRLISVAPSSVKPDLDELARRDGPLYEDVFFRSVNRDEVQNLYRAMGKIDTREAIKIVTPDLTTRPLVFEFKWEPNP